MTALSSDFTWKRHKGLAETFFFISQNGFDVDAAKQIITASPRELSEIEVEEAAWYLKRHIRPALPPGKWGQVDLKIPGIVATLPTSDLLLIDGWNRVAKAHKLRVAILPVVVLTATETASIRTKR